MEPRLTRMSVYLYRRIHQKRKTTNGLSFFERGFSEYNLNTYFPNYLSSCCRDILKAMAFQALKLCEFRIYFHFYFCIWLAVLPNLSICHLDLFRVSSFVNLKNKKLFISINTMVGLVE